jgi:hypothetical protein
MRYKSGFLKGNLIMPNWWITLVTSMVTLLCTLTVTLIFNKVVGLPRAFKKQKDLEKVKEEQIKQENRARDMKIDQLEADNRSRRAEVETERDRLQKTDTAILETCTSIQDSLNIINQRLDHLEKRERNSLRAKVLADYRIFTNKEKNPKLAWSEMEHHSFFELVRDYEDLDGNDYIHSVVLPEINKLEVIPMTDSAKLEEMYKLRRI